MPNGLKRVFLTALTDVDSTDKEGVGTLRFEGNKVYKYVKLQNTTATVAGAANTVCAYGLSGIADHLVVTDNSDSQTKPIGAGVLQAAVAGVAGTAYYLWIQVTGAFTDATGLAGTPSDGDALYLSTTDLTLTLATAADDPICAYADDASADECIAAFKY